MWRSLKIAVMAWFAVCIGARAGGRAVAGPLTYERDVRPIFKAHCFQCHGEGEKLKGGLDLRLRRFAVKGGESGAAIVPGDRDNSFLFQRINKGEMPPEKRPRLSAAEVVTVGRWIAAGAPTIRPEPESVGGEPIPSEDDRNFWSFRPIRATTPPAVHHADRVRTPIDAFLLAKLEEKGLSFSADADKRTLIRRATFDLTGLPPTPGEVEAFVADGSPDAYERLVDRLLASPHYGERWGRHWLDVAGYADSEGYNEADAQRKYAWHYRDYVIRSLNEDKPFDRFVVEQLAGDELVKPPYRDLSPADVEKLTATGFLRMAPDGSAAAGAAKKTVINQVVADEIKVVSGALLGLTVGCAQCHDHRYDPISQADYYRLRAVFEPAFDTGAWRLPAARLVPISDEAHRRRAGEIEAEAAKIDAERKRREGELLEQAAEKEIAKLPEALRDSAREARKTPAAKRTAEQKELLKQHPAVELTFKQVKLDKQTAAELQKLTARAAAVRATKPAEEFVPVLSEVPGRVPATYLFARGDCEQPKQAVQPAELTVLACGQQPAIASKDQSLPTSGRRLAYARWLTSGRHPLLARVLVNRVWMHHFGRGIVGTPGDFGALGERPTHPELLDWLASDFMTHGWKLKRLHKLIMLSTAYRQSSVRTPGLDAIDPDNRLYGRRSIVRLDAEQFRDAVLASSGKLNGKMFGPPVPVMPDEVGQFVVGKENLNAGRPGPVIPLNGEEFRRSVYVEVRRSRPLSVLSTFDEPAMEPNCEARTASTVAPQALMLMNNDFVVSQAAEFARRVRAEAGSDPAARAKLAWAIAFGTSPSEKDVAELTAFLADQQRDFETAKPAATPAKGAPREDPSLQAMATLCQALWSANGFLYID